MVLFVRVARNNGFGTAPYTYLGPAHYVKHEGERPIAITWRLDEPMPAGCSRPAVRRWHDRRLLGTPPTHWLMCGRCAGAAPMAWLAQSPVAVALATA